MTFPEALSFDDVLLVPQFGTVDSRFSEEISLYTKLAPNMGLSLPIISSPMDTVTEGSMARAMWEAGGVGVIHRYNSVEEQLKHKVSPAFMSVGANSDGVTRAKWLIDRGCTAICIDVAHGDHRMVVKAIEEVRTYGGVGVTIMAGNVATPSGAKRLSEAGADCIRVGIGSGSLCTTRLVTGHGIPTFQSILDIHNQYPDIVTIADGGIKTSGDIVKSLAAGASAVMVGRLLAGCDEAPGTLAPRYDGEYLVSQTRKSYRGMASFDSQFDWGKDRSKIVPEGEAMSVDRTGPVKEVLRLLEGGIRSGMSYSDARNIKELQEHAQFVRVTASGHRESTPHAKG